MTPSAPPIIETRPARPLIDRLAQFAASTRTADLPPEVVDESKRILLDSIGCAIAAIEEPKGRIGIEYGLMTGGSGGRASIYGMPHRASVFGAAFANGELINALDFDAVLPPGHVCPYVLPGLLAEAEAGHVSGARVVEAIAVSHEMTYRLGKAMDYVRDMAGGEVRLPDVFGYASSVFGAAAAIGMVRGSSAEVIANALGIAGVISPVNSHRAWMMHAPSTTIKYTMAGSLVNAALTAHYMAELGHRGDHQVLDDDAVGYRRFIGSRRWEPSGIGQDLGTEWGFISESAFKPYPHCRVLHAPLDALRGILSSKGIQPEDISAIRMWGEGWIQQPVWLNNRVERVEDAQFSVAHGLALGAHGVEPSRAWQSPELVFSDSVLSLMDKVTFSVHPDYADQLSKHPSARPTRIEVDAHGQTHATERTFAKGSPSPDPSTRMTTEELVAKFRVNVSGILPDAQIEALIEGIQGLENLPDAAAVLGQASLGGDR